MSREYTLFQFDVDEAAVRRVLAAIPGVTPLPSGGEESTEADAGPVDRDESRQDEGDSPTADDAGRNAGTPVTDDAGESDATRATPGAGSDRADRQATGPSESGRWSGVAPSTPWPGAPGDEASSDKGLLTRLGARKLLIAAGLVLGLGVVGVAVVWFLKRRGDEGAATDEPSAPERPHENGDAEDAASRSYPIDVAPLVGMTFLAVVALAVRRLRPSEA